MIKNEVFINGRFLTQPTTGVQRFALELLSALDRSLKNDSIINQSNKLICLVPNHISDLLLPSWQNIAIQKCGKLSGNLWEQIELPFFSRNGLLLNLCNIGPLTHNKQIIVFHDASVFAFPQSYSVGFKLKYYLFMGILSRTAKQVLTVSQFSKKELAYYLKIKEESISVISEGCEHILHSAMDDQLLINNDLLKSSYILAVGSASSQKNLSSVIKAIEESSENSIPLVIVGGDFNKIFKYTKNAKSEKVMHLGYVTDAELRSLYSHALGFIFPSLYEGFGLPPLEAMACGCPVICSKKPSMTEICGDAVLYFDPNDVEDIRQTIERFVKEPTLQNDLRIKGYQQSGSYTWEKAANLLIKYLV
jgi:glycosyltransferase involved in cell wall biosynthesis